MSVETIPVGDHLREWRRRRRMSQLDLACEAEISSRHLSFVETGRASPSRDMILRLAEQLEVPMRERNVLLVSAGYAPVFPQRSFDAPEMEAARGAIDIILQGLKPFPAFALDRHWNIAASNSALPQLYEGVADELLARPVNAMRLTLHPRGLAPKIVNLAQWREHMLNRLRHQIELTADAALIDLLAELQSYAGGSPTARRPTVRASAEMVIPFRVRIGDEVASFMTTTMVFGSPVEVSLSELAIELFFPADPETDRLVRRLAAG